MGTSKAIIWSPSATCSREAPPYPDDAENEGPDMLPGPLKQAATTSRWAPPAGGILRDIDPPGNEISKCVIFGPSQTCKSTFMAAWARACHVPAETEITCHYKGASLTHRPRNTDWLPDISWQTTQHEFLFELKSVRQQRGRNTNLDARTFQCWDTPGSLFFSHDFSDEWNEQARQHERDKLLDAARSATCLLFFVNPLEAKRQDFDSSIFSFFADVSRPFENPDHSLGSHLTDYWWISAEDRTTRWAPAPAAQIPVDRILFVFNRIDQLCLSWLKNGQVRTLQHLKN